MRPPVKVIQTVKDWSKGRYWLRLPAAPASDYELFRGPDAPDGAATLMATCASARALSEYALDNGAREVRFDFDLKLIEERGR